MNRERRIQRLEQHAMRASGPTVHEAIAAASRQQARGVARVRVVLAAIKTRQPLPCRSQEDILAEQEDRHVLDAYHRLHGTRIPTPDLTLLWTTLTRIRARHAAAAEALKGIYDSTT